MFRLAALAVLVALLPLGSVNTASASSSATAEWLSAHDIAATGRIYVDLRRWQAAAHEWRRPIKQGDRRGFYTTYKRYTDRLTNAVYDLRDDVKTVDNDRLRSILKRLTDSYLADLRNVNAVNRALVSGDAIGANKVLNRMVIQGKTSTRYLHQLFAFRYTR